ncbi:MAG: hypothetical protein ACXADB_07910 [Candidatus Hermodarchaeia archaeon]|jgi:hypothetical protein
MKAVSIIDSARDMCSHWDGRMFGYGGSVEGVCIGLGRIRGREFWREVERACGIKSAVVTLGPVYYGVLNP